MSVLRILPSITEVTGASIPLSLRSMKKTEGPRQRYLLYGRKPIDANGGVYTKLSLLNEEAAPRHHRQMKETVPFSLTSYVLESGLRVMLVPNFHTWRLPGSSCLYNHYIAPLTHALLPLDLKTRLCSHIKFSIDWKDFATFYYFLYFISPILILVTCVRNLRRKKKEKSRWRSSRTIVDSSPLLSSPVT